MTVETNQTFYLDVVLQAHCDMFGCASTLESLSLPSPFRVQSSSPTIPTRFVNNLTSVNLTIVAPSVPATYNLTGSIEAIGIPPVVSVTSGAWTVAYSDTAIGETLAVTAAGIQVEAKGASVVTENLTVRASGGLPSYVDSWKLSAGLALKSTLPSGSVWMAPNSTQNFTLQIQLPDVNSTVALSGRAEVTVLAEANLSWDMSLGGRYLLDVSGGPPFVTNLTPNDTFQVSYTFPSIPYPGWYNISYVDTSTGGLVILEQPGTMVYHVTTNSVTFTVAFEVPSTVRYFFAMLHFDESASS